MWNVENEGIVYNYLKELFEETETEVACER